MTAARARYTLVSFHAHPDDEALLTGGTLARAAAEGHRVVLVVATAGEAGLTGNQQPGPGGLGGTRLAELAAAARALGVARTHVLGYADSGMADAPTDGPDRFAAADIDEAANRLAEVLTEERADVLTVYDPQGGYGHPDHVQVTRVGVRAAELAGTPCVLEATVDRDALLRIARLTSLLPRVPAAFRAVALQTAYTPHVQLTHRVDVRAHAGAKRAAMAAHASQATGGTTDQGPRTLAAFLRLPKPVYRRVFGFEFFVERGRAPGSPLLDDVFASLRGAA